MKLPKFSLFLFILLVSCAPVSTPVETPAPTGTLTPSSSSTSLPATPSPWPTVNFRITPDTAQVARWQEYEHALAKLFLPTASSEGIVLCEWEILGQAEREVYVWAICQASGPIPSMMSAPAVLYLGLNGAVNGVVSPGSGSLYGPGIRRLFPPDVQVIIFAHPDVREMEKHILVRQQNPGPPLIVLAAGVQP
jgi:hypothetical protein